MEFTMVVVAFILGILLAITGTIGIIRGTAGGGGSLKLPGIELQGATGSVVVLLVGVVLIFTARSWNQGLENQRSLASAAESLGQKYKQQVELNSKLRASLPASTKETLERTHPDAFVAADTTIAPAVRRQILEAKQLRPIRFGPMTGR